MESRLTTKDIEEAIRQLSTLPPERALVDLTAITNRAIIELHKVARQQASQQRGQADWGKWAKLANAARSGVLQVAAIRDSVKGIAPQSESPARDG